MNVGILKKVTSCTNILLDKSIIIYLISRKTEKMELIIS